MPNTSPANNSINNIGKSAGAALSLEDTYTKTSTSFLLYRLADKPDPLEYFNEDSRELLNGEVFSTEENAKQIRDEGSVRMPIIVELDISDAQVIIKQRANNFLGLAKHVRRINDIAVEYNGAKFIFKS